MKQIVLLALWVGLIVVFLEQPAAAYLDPGSGSLILQVLLGGVAAVGVLVKLSWHRLLEFFKIGSSRDSIDHN